MEHPKVNLSRLVKKTLADYESRRKCVIYGCALDTHSGFSVNVEDLPDGTLEFTLYDNPPFEPCMQLARLNEREGLVINPDIELTDAGRAAVEEFEQAVRSLNEKNRMYEQGVALALRRQHYRVGCGPFPGRGREPLSSDRRCK